MTTSFCLPGLYAKYNQVVLKQTLILLKKYGHSINYPTNASILEFGFGDGTNFEHSVRPNLSSDYKEYIATDISKKMMDFSRSTIVVPNMNFQELAIDSLTIPDELRDRFDLIFSFFTNHLIQNPKQMFKNIHSMLKPEGQTFQITLERSPLDIIFFNMSKNRRWFKYGHEKIMSPYYHFPSPKEGMENDIKHGGFENFQLKIEPYTYEFDSAEEWRGLFHSTNPIISNIPVEDVAEYKEDYFNEIEKTIIIKDENRKLDLVNNNLYVIFAIK